MVENDGMDYLEFKLWKVLVFLAIIFVWQFWRGLNGLPVELEQPDSQAGSAPPERKDG